MKELCGCCPSCLLFDFLGVDKGECLNKKIKVYPQRKRNSPRTKGESLCLTYYFGAWTGVEESLGCQDEFGEFVDIETGEELLGECVDSSR